MADTVTHPDNVVTRFRTGKPRKLTDLVPRPIVTLGIRGQKPARPRANRPN